MSLLTKFLAAYYRSGLRGSYRITDLLAGRFRSLQSVPIETENGVICGDLRIPSARGILAYPASQSGEDSVMRRFVTQDDVVFDIGAHLGFYTLLLSRLVGERGKVFAFEPNPELLPSLERTIAPLANVELLKVALSDREGEAGLFVPEDASMASLQDWTDGVVGAVHEVKCEMRVLDKMVEAGELPVPHFIKCDVEGAELSVFKGAVKTLDRADAPILLFELNTKAAAAFGSTTGAYFELLRSLDAAKYSFFEVTPDGVRELTSTDVEYTNVVAIPASKHVSS